MKFFRQFPRLLFVAIAMLTMVAFPAVPSAQGQGGREIVIGVLYTREPNTPASTRAVAAEEAARELNEFFQLTGDATRVRLVLRETGRDPARSVAAVQDFYAQGVRLVVGPETSEELRAFERLPIANDIVFVSYASTAPSLARRSGNVFRLAPDDTYQAEAIASLMWADGIRVVVPTWREDVYGMDLVDEVRRRFVALGGQVLPGVSYPTSTQNFADVTRQLGQQVAGAIEGSGRDAVAVYAVTFDEITGLMRAADATPGLGDVWWYGSDGTTLDQSVFADPLVSAFAWQTAFTGPLYGEDAFVQESLDVAEAIRLRTGIAPEPYAYATYDAVMLAGLGAAQAGSSATTQQLSAAIGNVASTFFGLTGPMTLNARGDRIVGDYEFWTVEARAGELYWTQVGNFTFEPGGAGVLERSRPHRRPRLPVDTPFPVAPGR